MKVKYALIFIVGVISGGFITYQVNKRVTSHCKESIKIAGSEECVKGIVDGYKVGGFIGDNEYDSNIEDNAREYSNKSWTDADREHVSKLLFDNQYKTPEEAATLVDGELQLADDKILETEEDISEHIVNISAVEFVKAVANGQNIQSFIFDPFKKKFYWNISVYEVSDAEITNYLGMYNYNDILEESSVNANGWVQTKYYYNKLTDTYVKVETGRSANKYIEY